MSFWKSKKHKSRKQRVCEWCGKTINKGEDYYRESGVSDIDSDLFQDYALHVTCKEYMKAKLNQEKRMNISDETLQKIREDLCHLNKEYCFGCHIERDCRYKNLYLFKKWIKEQDEAEQEQK